MYVNADGTVRPCCFFNDRIKDGDREMNVAVDSIKSIRDSQYLKNLRSEFLQGKKIEVCNQCWRRESAGLHSERINNSKKYLADLEPIPDTTDSRALDKIGVALGNICNLKCRICGPWASSSWNADEIKTMSQQQRIGTIEEKMLTMGAWPLKNDLFWAEFAEEIKTVNELRIYGGEPMMIPKHFEVLQYLVDHDYAKNIKLIYNTNGTHFPSKAVEHWSKFLSVYISLSIDNLKQKFEYERKNASWSEVTDNLEKFIQVQQQYENIELHCTITVSVYNVLDLVDIAKWVEPRFSNRIFWNILEFAEDHNIARLSKQSKEYVKNKLLNNISELSEFNKNSIKNVVKYMMDNEFESLEPELIQRIRRIDLARKENLQDTHPELCALLNYTG
jgi:MoaA/NifB/PqqE/SkfB family radical SAM enzyme